MSKYRPEYSRTFKERLEELGLSKKMKKMLEKAILFILESPYTKAENFTGDFRKNICAGKLRIFYDIFEEKKLVRFNDIDWKNKNTYKGRL